MAVISIPKKIIKDDDLIIVSRKKYEELLYSKARKDFFPVIKHSKKPHHIKLDQALKKALKEYKTGRYYGPFKNAEDGIKFLESHRTTQLKK